MSSAPSMARFFWDLLNGFINLLFGRLRFTPPVPERNLTGKVAIVTGANSGIGLSISQRLAAMGATVYMACRNMEKGEGAAREVRDYVTSTSLGRKQKSEVHVVQLDTSSIASVRSLVQQLPTGPKVDFVYHNAGIPGVTDTFTEDNLEMTYQTNFLGSFLLTHLLDTKSMLSSTAKIIFTTSTGQYGGAFSPDFSLGPVHNEIEKGFHTPAAAPKAIPSVLYSNTKLMQAALAKLLQRRFEENGSQISAACFTPDYCATPIFGKVEKADRLADPFFYLLQVATFIAIPIEKGAATGVMLATKEVQGNERGAYWDLGVRRVSKVRP